MATLITAAMSTQVAQLYVSLFNRAPERDGLGYWVQELANGKTMAQVAADMYAVEPARAVYPSFYTNDQIITAFYTNVLGRTPDAEGKAYWVAKLNASTPGAVVVDMINAVVNYAGTDAAGLASQSLFANKVEAGLAYAVTNLGNNPVVAAQVNALVETGANGAVAAIAFASGAAIATTTTLTAGADTVTGTVGNDIINALTIDATGAAKGTFTGFDSIDGGAGNDVFNIYSDGVATINDVYPTNATVKNVEAINIFNTAAGFGVVDAANFVGATTITQVGVASAVTNLAATTTAGFKGLTATALDVTATDAATSATIALTAAKGVAVTNVATLAVAGAALNAVNVSGTIAQTDTAAADPAASLALNVTAGEDVLTLSVNSAVKTTLAVTEGAGSTKEIATVDASASTGGITFDGTVTGGVVAPSTIKTGAGADDVSIVTALDAVTKTATLSTGAGDDILTVNVTGTALAGNTIAVTSGDGADEIDLTIASDVTYSVNGGAGADLIAITGTVKTTDLIDGGADADTVAIDGKLTYVADDYIVYTKVLKNFEALEFTGVTAVGTAFTAGNNLDASELADFKAFTFDAGGFVSKVAADQALSTAADLSAKASGYVAGDNTATPATTTTYAGSLKVAVTANATVTAFADSAALTVTAETGALAANVAAVLTGDLKTATVALAHGMDTGTEVFSVASLTITTATTETNGAYTALGGLTSLTLTGNGNASITNAASTKLVTVDASALNSVDEDGVATTGLVYASSNASAETIKLGGGLDDVTLSASTYAKIDSVQGLNLVLDPTNAALLDASSDLFVVTGVTGAVKTFTTTQTDFAVALKDAAAYSAANGNVDLVFVQAGNTYVFSDAGSDIGLIDATDIVVKLVGTVNLDALIVALA